MDTKKKAFYFILLMGIVSLFSDITYEGARSIIGPYLGLLGASSIIISAVAGLGEFLGYSLRLATGVLVDKTKKYWLFAILGYAVNLLVIPTLALTNHWWQAAVLIILERVGKALRKPAKDTITSFASSQIGYGKGFAIDEVLDQLGAVVGPVVLGTVIASSVSQNGDISLYRKAFSVLLYPALLTLLVITIARILVPNPSKFESEKKRENVKFNKTYYLFIVGSALIAFGFSDFALIAFHAQKNSLLNPAEIPFTYALAMGVDALAALLFGVLFDKIGGYSLALATFAASPFGIFVFSNQKLSFILGAILWGIGIGAQESVLKAAVAKLTSKEKRATAYGIMNTVFGASWFVGSILIGILYSVNIEFLKYFVLITQILAGIVIIYALRLSKSNE